MKEQFDLFKKPAALAQEETLVPESEPYRPTDAEIAFAHGGKPVAPEKRLKAEKFAEKRAEDLKKLFEEAGTQKDLPLRSAEQKQNRP